VLVIARFASASMELPTGSVCLAFCASEEAVSENKTVASDTNFKDKLFIVNKIVVEGLFPTSPQSTSETQSGF